MDVALISPVNTGYLREFTLILIKNQFSMSRLIGLGLTLIKNNDLEDESLNRNFIVQKFSFEKIMKISMSLSRILMILLFLI